MDFWCFSSWRLISQSGHLFPEIHEIDENGQSDQFAIDKGRLKNNLQLSLQGEGEEEEKKRRRGEEEEKRRRRRKEEGGKGKR